MAVDVPVRRQPLLRWRIKCLKLVIYRDVLLLVLGGSNVAHLDDSQNFALHGSIARVKSGIFNYSCG